jgi:hypothetical protein
LDRASRSIGCGCVKVGAGVRWSNRRIMQAVCF